ncbi:helix-turn-helix domain-containing protein [uncultured Cloacibacillus sp.]|uniref:helix-turn-helix domain-containing protein n=1 Tax=uncultured Cloacibacillus sp. TaxID=889794 RepID=UPI0027D9756E|nr:helix-turn-helix domain-containing protein [uncultured Cloacibacillus sp.]
MTSDEAILQIQDDRGFWFAAVDICVLRDKTLSFNAKGVYAVLVAFVNIGTKEWAIKTETLAAECGVSRRTVMYALKELVEHGYIERKKRHADGHQIASIYKIIGHKAACNIRTLPKQEQPDEPACNICTQQGAEYAHQLQEPESLNNTLSSIKGADAPEAAPEDIRLIDKIPLAMRPTAEYLLLKTGRKGLIPSEVGSLLALEKIHLPARIQQEINTAVKRFASRGRPLSGLTAGYLYESLRHQNSRLARKKAPPDNGAAQAQVQAQAQWQEDEHDKYLFEKFGKGVEQIE